ncbi:MAG: MerR family transcriptional regulator [Rhizobiales bacterium]|nr:MerR family transcriptional regulator [Hyphomicrobiales bacterium]OJY01475.1 MAG: hypothetical protein BGP07_12570 [Rhizobiales bacterium 63-22]
MTDKVAGPEAIAALLTTRADLKGREHLSGGSVFRIGDLAQEFGVTLRTLRFYEGRGLLNPRRAGVTRLYGTEDRTRLRLILFGRRIGLTLAEMNLLIDLRRHDSGDEQLRALREKLAGKLDELEKKRAEIDTSLEELNVILSRLDSVKG